MNSFAEACKVCFEAVRSLFVKDCVQSNQVSQYCGKTLSESRMSLFERPALLVLCSKLIELPFLIKSVSLDLRSHFQGTRPNTRWRLIHNILLRYLWHFFLLTRLTLGQSIRHPCQFRWILSNICVIFNIFLRCLGVRFLYNFFWFFQRLIFLFWVKSEKLVWFGRLG